VRNDPDRFGVVMYTLDRAAPTGAKGIDLKQQLKGKRIGDKHYIDKYGEDLPEIRHWHRGATSAGNPAHGAQAPKRMFAMRTTPNESEAEQACHGANQCWPVSTVRVRA